MREVPTWSQELQAPRDHLVAATATSSVAVLDKQAEIPAARGGQRVAPGTDMAGVRDFRELAAWQLARELKLAADALLGKPEVRRRFQYCDQLSDSARSAPRNIAEGFARYRHKEFAQFVRIAKGSEAEVLNHFIDAHDLRLMTDEEFRHGEHLARRSIKAANGLIRYLEATPDRPAPNPARKPRPPRRCPKHP
ncbi:MAG TPA: four helix bundle protein [Vicinamibacterales bacterium]|nr:four helix bundle protein [Vicinamibacterales bacterium]